MASKLLYYKKYILVLLILITSGCSGVDGQNALTPSSTETSTPPPATPTRTPTPQRTQTPSPSNTPVTLVSPTPTATPVIHEVQSGQTIIGIANLYDIEVEDLVLANPSVNPNLLPIGITLTIPITVETESRLPITTLDLEMLGLSCFDEALGPTWCLANLINDHASSYVNVSVSLSTLDEDGNTIDTVPASTPILFFPSGSIMPFGFYFPNGKSEQTQFSLSITTGTEISPEIENDLWQPLDVEEEVLARAETTMEIRIAPSELPQNTVSVYTIGYLLDENEDIIGYRVQETETPPSSGEFTQTMVLNSLGPAIEDYRIFAFARLGTD